MIWISIAGTEVRVRLRPSVRARRVGSRTVCVPGARSPGARSRSRSGPAGSRGIDGRVGHGTLSCALNLSRSSGHARRVGLAYVHTVTQGQALSVP